MGYLSPEAETEARSEHEAKRSRFIGIARAARSEEAVEAALARLRIEFPDASHHCWAAVLGDPTASPVLRWDDDGEPGGTAGRPILNVLTQREIGDALVVVVRFFGGVKLGAGGLVRAYSSTAGAALDAAVLVPSTVWSDVTLSAGYADERRVRRVIDDQGAVLVDVSYARAEAVDLSVRYPQERREALGRALSDATNGRVRLELESES